MNNAKVYIVHGWGGTPGSNWFPWLSRELIKKDVDVIVPLMPETDKPNLISWLLKLEKLIDDSEEDIYLVGHSLGCITILKYLEKTGRRVGGVLLVAGFSRSLKIPEIENFLEKQIDYKKISDLNNKIVVINSDNDPFVPLEEGRILKDKLGAELIIMENAYHINEGNGFFELPIGLDVLLKMINR
jgi:uncharacterized protein